MSSSVSCSSPPISSNDVAAVGRLGQERGHLGQVVDVGLGALALRPLRDVLAGGVVGGARQKNQSGSSTPVVRPAVRLVERPRPAHLPLMSRTMKALLGVWIAALAAAAVWIGWGCVSRRQAAIGGPFALTDQDGRTVTCDSLKGKPT